MDIKEITPAQMEDAIDRAVNGTDFRSGKSDAIVHVAQLTTGEKTPEELADVQTALESGIMDGDYIRGYWAAWHALHAMLVM